ncbi:MAG: metal-dependent hydrolase [Bacteroidetes bacterium]|nr:metal-dependent hydrolase [Bacteroidota bacterium]
MTFTYYGHSCFLIESDGVKFLFDPFITGNPKAIHINVDSIEADYILVSHAHHNHIADLNRIAKRTKATVIASYEVVMWAEGCHKFHAMNYGACNFDFGEVRMVPAAHSSTLPDGKSGGCACGFILSLKSGNFYYSGDTGLTVDMRLIPQYYAKLDFAILPVGGNFTLNPRGAVIASDFIQCNKIIGVHFDTFEYIAIDKPQALKLFSDAGKELILPVVGSTFELATAFHI